jgi:DNA-binding transcriptional ArsR family regulator
MSRDPFQPEPAQISLSAVYDALSDPVRRAIVVRLADTGEQSCSAFLDYGSKTALSYHLARLREAGITATRVDGKLRFMTLRQADLEKRFPGLLPAVIASARIEAGMTGTEGSAKTPSASGGVTKPAGAAKAAKSGATAKVAVDRRTRANTPA